MVFRSMRKTFYRHCETNMYKAKFVIIIPTFRRVEALNRCLGALEKQTIKPDLVIIVRRDSDHETVKFISQYREKAGSLNISDLIVSEPGFIPPVKEGLRVATGDYVSILDDDVIVCTNWVEKGLNIFKKNGPCLGAVSGASIGRYKSGTVFPTRLFWFGRFAVIKNKIRSTKKINAFGEGNLIMRGEASAQLDVDMRLNSGRIAHHGLDFGLQLINHGWEIQYDPQLNAEHLALRAQDHEYNSENITTYIHNLAYIINKHHGRMRLIIFVFYNLVVGQYDMPGLLYGCLKHGGSSKFVSVARRALISEIYQLT